MAVKSNCFTVKIIVMGKIKTLSIIAFFSLVPTIILWLPFIFSLENFWGIPLPKSGMATIVANYDGPLYMVVAKTLYNKDAILSNFSFPLPTEYYAAHFPLFPLLIKLSSYVLGLPYGMLFVTLFFAFTSLLFFYKIAEELLGKQKALWLTFVSSVFPARWLVVRSVGSAETLFLTGVLGSIYYFNRKNYLLAGIFGAIATFTKSPGILLFVSFLIALIFPAIKDFAHSTLDKIIKNLNLLKTLPLLLIPLALVGVFYVYSLTYSDFFAYFKSGDNIHLFFPPFQIFNYSAPWVGTFWLEEIVVVYLLLGYGVIRLFKKELYNMAIFSAVFLLSLIFVSHRDLIRYALPMVPFVLISYSDVLTKKEFKYLFVILLVPIYLFSLSFISQNVMPIGNWEPFL